MFRFSSISSSFLLAVVLFFVFAVPKGDTQDQGTASEVEGQTAKRSPLLSAMRSRDGVVHLGMSWVWPVDGRLPDFSEGCIREWKIGSFTSRFFA